MTPTPADGETIRRAATLTQQGIELFFRGRYAEAIALLDQALAFNPLYVRGHCGRAMCLAQLGNAEEALATAERALALDPAAGLTYSIRALCRHRCGDDVGAEEDHRRALELAPDDYRGYYNFACYWAERRDEEKCRQYLTYAFQLATAAFAAVAAEDPDLARYAGRLWFRDLVADTKRRAAGGT